MIGSTGEYIGVILISPAFYLILTFSIQAIEFLRLGNSTSIPSFPFPPSPLSTSKHDNSRPIPRPLSTKPRQPTSSRPKPHDRTLGKEKGIPLLGIHLLLDHILAISILELRNLHIAFEEDLHFVVGVGVDEFGARLEAVETGGDGVGGAVAVMRVWFRQ